LNKLGWMGFEMAEDPYKVLGVPRTATDEEIRRTYRKLAKELHPDLNPANRAQAEERFKKVSGAYEIVGDPEKRKQYDRGEIDANGEQRRSYQRAHAGGSPFAGRTGARPGDDFGFGDIFSDLFGSMRGGRGTDPAFRLRGQDIRYTLEVDFLEAVNGATKRVTMPEGGVLDLNVPEGVTDGQLLRLRGKGGAAGRGGEPGDALVEVRVRPHQQFKRAGDDITFELPIAIDEAIPKGTSSGRVFRLKGKGVRNSATGNTGDQLVTVHIVLPDKIDDELSYFLSEWRLKHRYNPGRSS
jgi:DnaJ-class molecular chaperone